MKLLQILAKVFDRTHGSRLPEPPSFRRQVSFNDRGIRCSIETPGEELKTLEITWDAIDSFSSQTELKIFNDMMIYLKRAPYTVWIPEDTEGVQEVREELLRRGVRAGNKEELSEEHDKFLRENVYTEQQVVNRVRRDFRSEDVAEVLTILAQYAEEEPGTNPEFMQLAMLRLANGDKQRLRESVKTAKMDFRDIIGAIHERYGTDWPENYLAK
ncbi:MAG: hypothetical protein WAV47_07970 [Blastocatellia bacterium]